MVAHLSTVTPKQPHAKVVSTSCRRHLEGAQVTTVAEVDASSRSHPFFDLFTGAAEFNTIIKQPCRRSTVSGARRPFHGRLSVGEVASNPRRDPSLCLRGRHPHGRVHRFMPPSVRSRRRMGCGRYLADDSERCSADIQRTVMLEKSTIVAPPRCDRPPVRKPIQQARDLAGLLGFGPVDGCSPIHRHMVSTVPPAS